MYAPTIKDSLDLTQTQVATVGSAVNLGGYFAIVSGAIYDSLKDYHKLGPRWVGQIPTGDVGSRVLPPCCPCGVGLVRPAGCDQQVSHEATHTFIRLRPGLVFITSKPAWLSESQCAACVACNHRYLHPVLTAGQSLVCISWCAGWLLHWAVCAVCVDTWACI